LYFLNSRKPYQVFNFDFCGSVNEQLPLTYNVLKSCKSEISKLRNSKNSQELLQANTIKLIINKNISLSSIKNISDLKEFYQNSVLNSYYNIKYNFNSRKDLFVFKIENFIGLSGLNLNPNAYYVINGRLYLSYKDSFILFNDEKLIKRGLANKNNIKYFFLYKKNILERYSNITFTNIIDNMFLKLILSIHLIYLKSNLFSRFDFRLKQTN
jgi:hypothetical protein